MRWHGNCGAVGSHNSSARVDVVTVRRELQIDEVSVMKLLKKTMIAAVVFGGGLSTLPATSSAAYATADVYERSGPGTYYSIIATVPAGSYVKIHGCLEYWCRVTWRGIYGWISSAYLDRGSYGYQNAPHYRYRYKGY